jgi:hypothetical protein
MLADESSFTATRRLRETGPRAKGALLGPRPLALGPWFNAPTRGLQENRDRPRFLLTHSPLNGRESALNPDPSGLNLKIGLEGPVAFNESRIGDHLEHPGIVNCIFKSVIVRVMP